MVMGAAKHRASTWCERKLASTDADAYKDG